MQPDALPDGLAGTLAAVGLVLFAYGTLFGATELLRRHGVAGETTRTTAHVLSSLVGLALPFLFRSPLPVVLLGVGFACGMVVSRAFGMLRSVHDVVRPSVGAPLYPLGIAAAFAITGGAAPGYPMAVLALGFGDPAASLVGRRFGRHRITICGTTRSLEGSTGAFLAASALAAVVLLGTAGGDVPTIAAASLTVGLAVAVAEALSPVGLDNLAIPIVAAAVSGAVGTPWGLAAVILLLVDAGVVVAARRGRPPLQPLQLGRLR